MKKITLLLVLLSLSLFGIGQTTIEITAPNGGESFVPGETIDIDYTVNNGVTFDSPEFHYSIDGGLNYIFISLAPTIPNSPPAVYTNTVSWTIPLGINSTECLIRAKLYRGGIGYLSIDDSDNLFTIQSPITGITLVSPNGGETYQSNNSIYIQYQFENGEVGDDLIFKYSIDGGTTYTLIGNKGYSFAPMTIEIDSILWDIPSGINSNNCFVVCDIIRGSSIGNDTTDNSFTISLPATINHNQFNNVSIYPNPFQNSTIVDLNGLKDVSINIYSITGKLLLHENNINTSTYQINLDVEKGIYFVELSNHENSITYKIIKD